MVCHNCYKYGHTKARCKWKGVCRNWEKDDHKSDETNKYSNESKYANFWVGHMALSNDYEMEQKEIVS